MKRKFAIVYIILLVLTLIIFFCSCTKNQMVKNYGGKGELILPKGEKLITVTWKDEHLWYLTRSMSANDSVETYIFKESSSLGILEGTFIIKEGR